MFKSRLWHTLSVLLLAAVAGAANVAVLPFASQDPALGTAVAHAVSEALSAEHEVIGPAASPTLVPPFLVEDGFYNPAGFYADSAGPGVTAMLRAGSGTDLALNGRIDSVDGLLVMELHTAHREGINTIVLQVPADAPGQLARRVAAIASHLLGDAAPAAVPTIDMAGVDGARARAIFAAGQPGGLQAALEALAVPELADDPYSQVLRNAITAVQEGRNDADPLLLATLSLNTAGLDEIRSALYFEALANETRMPVFHLWQAMLLASSGYDAAAAAVLEEAATFPYGMAALHAWHHADPGAYAAELPTADAPALIAYSVLARSQGESGLEREALRLLTRIDPWQTWAFERLSFIAFDEDDSLAAGQALAVAVRLQPDSDLYWTNLGWAQYLLGLLEASEDSSIRATLLAPGQYIAHYNLGLVRTVTGRLDEAVDAYNTALRHDPAVDEAAIDDLIAALERYPREPAVHWSLAYLLESSGQRTLAARHYASYARQVGSGEYVDRARARIERLEAPPPVLQLPGGVRLLLGSQSQDPSEVQAGDPLRPVFEVYTPGEALPTVLQLEFSLVSADGSRSNEARHELTLPTDTVGFVIDRLTYALPADLEPGDWDLQVTVLASEDREVSSTVGLSVHEPSDPLRRLFGYGITLESFEGGSALFDSRDLGHWDRAVAVLLSELALTGEAADEVLPEISTGRFSGMSGGEAFRASGEEDLRDFINWIAHPDLEGANFVFVDTYAQWVVDGAPTE